jgi:hypothetical protein
LLARKAEKQLETLIEWAQLRLLLQQVKAMQTVSNLKNPYKSTLFFTGFAFRGIYI